MTVSISINDIGSGNWPPAADWLSVVFFLGAVASRPTARINRCKKPCPEADRVDVAFCMAGQGGMPGAFAHWWIVRIFFTFASGSAV
jgi:hypothetical protein